MNKATWLTVSGVFLLQLDSWVLQTKWLALIGCIALIVAMFIFFKEEQ